MTIYIENLLILNFIYDYLILLLTSITLKRNINKKRIIFSTIIGMFSTFILFIDINEYLSLFIKVLISILMILISFKYISFKYFINNIIYFYMISITLAGILYFLNLNFKHSSYLLLLIISPIVLYLYHKNKSYEYNYYYDVEICIDNKIIKCLGYLDSANNLTDPVTKKSVIIINKKLLNNINIRSPVYVPYNTVNSSSIMKCYRPSYIIINNKKIYNYLIGVVDYEFSDGIKCLLNNKLRKDNYV